MQRTVTVVLLVKLSLAAYGCTSAKLTGSGPYGTGDAIPQGLRYYLGEDVVMVKATASYEVNREANFDLSDFEAVVELKKTDAAVSIVTVADTDSAYVLNVTPASMKKQDLKVGVGSNGVLTSVNYESTDQTGLVLANIAKATANIAGAVLGFPGLADDPAKSVFDDTELGRSLKSDQYDRALSRFRALPRTTIMFVSTDEGQGLWNRFAALDHAVAAEQERQVHTLEKAASAAATNQIKLHEAQAAALAKATEALQEQRDGAQAGFRAALDRYRTLNRLGSSTYKRDFVHVFRLAEVPQSANLTGKSFSEAEAALANWPKARQLFLDAGVVVELEVMPAAVSSSSSSLREPNEDIARLFYRQPRRALIRTYGLIRFPEGDSPVAAAKLRLVDETALSVLHPESPAVAVEFESKAFASQNLQLTFERGRLVSMEHASSSSLAGASGAIASAMASGRSELVSSLADIQKIQKSRQDINLADLQNQVNILQKRKELLDANLAYEGATASSDLVTEKARVDSELALLKAQLELAQTQGTAESATETALLQAQLSQLKAELELLKAQVALDKQRND